MSQALIVCPTYVRESRDLEVLRTMLESLRATEPGVEVLVIDDGSPERELVEAMAELVSRFQAELVTKDENEGFCSPPDEPVLTTRDGYVPIGSLDPGLHGLASFNPQSGELCGVRPGAWRPNGYAFSTSRSAYNGEMVVVTSERHETRVTPNHGLSFYWDKRAEAKWAVYLMRRGSDFRVGVAQFFGYRGTVGMRARMKHQGGTEIWALSLHDDRSEALAREALYSWEYGVPTLQFKGAALQGGISQHHLDEIWSRVETQDGAQALLRAHGRRLEFPLFRANAGRRKRLVVHACNLLPGVMRVPCLTDGRHASREHFSLGRERYVGDVVSLDVAPHEHYISGGVVVHNSRTVNVGLRRALAEGKDAVLVNADIEFRSEGWLGVMQRQPKLHGEGLAEVVGALLSYPSGLIQHGGIFFSFLARSFGHVHQYAPEHLLEAQIPKVIPVTGALQFIRHESLVSHGIYDEGFRLGYEDVDYCIRVMRDGGECVYQPLIWAYHYESMFRGAKTPKIMEWEAESWLHFRTKWADENFARYVPSLF